MSHLFGFDTPATTKWQPATVQCATGWQPGPSIQLKPSPASNELKEISDQLKEIKDQLKITPVQTNIYIDQYKIKSKTQSSTLVRKPRNSLKQLPLYVISGNAHCDKCLLSELIFGYHYGSDSDVCINCYSAVNNKDEWIEFSI